MTRTDAVPAVTVAVCLYNAARFIAETMASVLTQSRGDFELIVVDDGSTDGSGRIVQQRLDDPRITLLRLPHRGLGAARAAVVARARAPYIAFLDHDDVWQPTKLQLQMAAAAEMPAAGLLFTDSSLIDDDGRVLGAMSERFNYECFQLAAGCAERELLARGCFVPLSTALVRADILRRAGGVNARYQSAGDYELWLRIARISDVVYLPQRLSSWRIHARQLTQRHPETTALELRRIWAPVLHDRSYARDLRAIVGDHLIGQQRRALGAVVTQRRARAATRIILSALGEPRALAAYFTRRIVRLRLRHLQRLAVWCRAVVRRRRETEAPAAALVQRIGDDRVRSTRLSPSMSSTQP